MSTHSLIPAFKAQLLTLLQAALPGVQGGYALNPELERMNSYWLGDVNPAQHHLPIMMAGRKVREELFDLHVHFLARDSVSPQGAETLVLSYLSALEDTLANDPAIGLSGTEPTLRAHLKDFVLKLEVDMVSSNWLAEVKATVEAQVRLV